MAPFALLSVSDKTGLVPLAEALHRRHGYQLLSSGGTATVLEAAGLPVTRVSDHTGAPEILGGRVKTLHPRVHGGILAKRDDPAHLADLTQQNIAPIDLVVVNLYPFRETVAKPDVTWQEAIEKIDIGGPAMVRAAAKNHADVAVLIPSSTTPSLQPWRNRATVFLRHCGNVWPLRPFSTQLLTTRRSAAGWPLRWIEPRALGSLPCPFAKRSATERIRINKHAGTANQSKVGVVRFSFRARSSHQQPAGS